MTSILFDAPQAVADTRRWVERAVIGLNLCPFAKAVHVRSQIHYATYLSPDADGLMDLLLEEAQALAQLSAAVRDTTLLVLPNALGDFFDFNDFVGRAERRMDKAGHEGVLQLASFHPRFQFAGTDIDDIGNATNRAPHPTLHLIREESMSRAVEAFPEAEMIYERNIERLESMGAEGWAALDVGPGSAKP